MANNGRITVLSGSVRFFFSLILEFSGTVGFPTHSGRGGPVQSFIRGLQLIATAVRPRAIGLQFLRWDYPLEAQLFSHPIMLISRPEDSLELPSFQLEQIDHRLTEPEQPVLVVR
jgi:hypothetical protein